MKYFLLSITMILLLPGVVSAQAIEFPEFDLDALKDAASSTLEAITSQADELAEDFDEYRNPISSCTVFATSTALSADTAVIDMQVWFESVAQKTDAELFIDAKKGTTTIFSSVKEVVFPADGEGYITIDNGATLQFQYASGSRSIISIYTTLAGTVCQSDPIITPQFEEDIDEQMEADVRDEGSIEEQSEPVSVTVQPTNEVRNVHFVDIAIIFSLLTAAIILSMIAGRLLAKK